jgi:alginate O-acetyltransferase complex protein AlgI
LNFSDFSFWWILLLVGIPFFTLRYVAKSLNLWRDFLDSIGLVILSLMLFVNASPRSFIIFIVEIIFNYVMVYFMLRRRGWEAKAIATIVVAIDIGILAYFKYVDFFVQDVLGLVFGELTQNWKGIPGSGAIPPGISFYTFQMVAFVVDSFVSKKKQAIGFIDYINFVSFFPQVVAGPIERRSDLFPQIESFKFKFSLQNLEKGFQWLSLGLFMKFVLADNLAPFISLSDATNPWMVWFQALLFTLRIYFDFAGYSFMAVGLAGIIGVKLTLNFLAPYTSQSIQEFWRRWHITLSTWFRDYVFLPMMGANKRWAEFYLFLTFTLSGFWHGAAWNFILWGAYHGALLLLLRYLNRQRKSFVGQYVSKFPPFLSWALTFGSVTLGCLFFMETNISRLIQKMVTLVTPWAYSFANLGSMVNSFSVNEKVALSLTLALAFGVILLEQMAIWQKRECEYDLLLSPWVSRLLLGLTVVLAANTPSKFIYFEF